MRKRNKGKMNASRAPEGPTLLEFWRALKRGDAAAAARMRESDAPRAQGDAAAVPASSGSGSGGGGYGLGLIAPDPEDRARIAQIMRELCEKDAVQRR